ncbi:E3 ubiquitin-protein ligase [Rhynchospora pubera]|uniref:E3 ubiquitin-protein ligase n=1 Tax=Rhynchospora pubera TaxID=906938 RepID=A0AAV8EI12_9POAL|nr:E3 ubiquitin-protein ligase [Rhynchospora pubera]KAJ4806071.1 E3 ubiquitin-protein ligase [Rhynchospora pubera]
MPTYTHPSSSPPPTRDFSTILSAARPFLRGELETVDPDLPSLTSILCASGAGECYHKHGNFLSHLLDVYRILKLWSAPDSVARCGLFHSSYSNSYVNLAIFDASTSRDHVKSIIGEEAEQLVYLFCIVPRHRLIFHDLLVRYTDSELVEHLSASETSVKEAKEKGVFDSSEPWRKKLQGIIPAEGIKVEHIKTGEDVVISRRVMAVFLLMTVADFSDQYVDYQDKLFGNEDGRLEYPGDNWATLWPGTGKPGLWMNQMSRIAALYCLLAREEEIYIEERKQKGGGDKEDGRDEEIELVLPPVFDYCTKLVDPNDQIIARDLYWDAFLIKEWEKAEMLLVESCAKNPCVGEPHLVLAQVYLNGKRYEEAEKEAEIGLRLMLEWGSSWDKRMTWEGWISWGRVMLGKAKERDWPTCAWGIINLGLVK